MRYIELKHGEKTKVDNEDYNRLVKYKWWLHSRGYVAGYVDKKRVYMHRLIMGTPKGMDTDHINHNKLDNRRKNLRVCHHAVNLQNRTTKSGHRGCIKVINRRHKDYAHQYFIGTITIWYKTYSTKTYKTKKEARDNLVILIKNHGF